MSYKSSTGKSIQQSFDSFHQINPQVYYAIKDLAFKAILKGKKKISFKLLINVLRWQIFMETLEVQPVAIEGKEKKFKINDAYQSRYARLFAQEYPEHKEKIEFRELRS